MMSVCNGMAIRISILNRSPFRCRDCGAMITLGVSHRRASVELLERLAFADEELPKAYLRALDDEAVEEAVILSTCNRVEVYGNVPAYHAGFLALKRLLEEPHGVDPDELSDPLYSHFEDDACQHLFGVAAGSTRWSWGSPRSPRRSGRHIGGPRPRERRDPGSRRCSTRRPGPAGGCARGAVGAAPDAFVSAGAGLADEDLGGLVDRAVVVVGAGQMAALSVKKLRQRGLASVRVLNRSPERARLIAERTHAEYGDLVALLDAIRDADVVVSATGSTGLLIEGPMVRAAMADRAEPAVHPGPGGAARRGPSVSGIGVVATLST